MRSNSPLAAGIGLIALTFLVGGAAAQTPAPKPAPAPAPAAAAAPAASGDKDPLLATVNGSNVHLSEVKEEISGLPEQYRQLPMERIMPLMLNQIITNKLLVAEGNRQKLGDTEDVQKKVERARERAVQQALLAQVVGKTVTDDALKTLYKKYVAENPPKEEVSARHILLDNEAEATGIIVQLKGGADFAAVAKQKSKDPAAQNGGDLGFFGRDDMVKEFADAAFGMKTGEISAKPVRTQFGWHVIKVEDRRTANPVTFDEAREDLYTQLSQQAVSQYVETLRSGARIERFGPDGKPLEEPKKH